MVYYYKIRGGQCKGKYSHLTLRSEDIVCYVGRDKHENEYLIKYGWPGDVWFHVDDLSSAHVYFRLNYKVAANYHDDIPLDGCIPIDDLPENSIYDMMQIVKHNSIQGCKLSSCKIVYTPHSNLKKNFDMATGAVTYHNTKMCRYNRCQKDKQRVKELEKTKSEDYTDVDYYAEFKANEREIIERKKKARVKSGGGGGGGGTGEGDDTTLYDPILADQRTMKLKSSRQGDELSGIDQGVAALEALTFGRSSSGSGNNRGGSAVPLHLSPNKMSLSAPMQGNDDTVDNNTPIWKQEYTEWERLDYNETMIFLLERGYSKPDVDKVVEEFPDSTNVELLHKLWKRLVLLADDDDGGEASSSATIDLEELESKRQEEREVLEAIYGDDIEWLVGTDSLDCSIPISTYEPPERYHLDEDDIPPPQLSMEIYLKHTNYPFGHDIPTIAFVGGGFPQNYLREYTKRLGMEAIKRSKEEEPGDPQLFALLTYAGEIWEDIIQKEVDDQKQEKQRQREEAAKAKAVLEAEQHRLSNNNGNNNGIIPYPITSDKFVARYNGPKLEEMTNEQKHIRDEILQSRPGTGLSGPFGPWLAIPDIAKPAQALGRACRYGTSLAFRESELIILLTGAKTKAHAEFDIHVGEAIKAGISLEIITSIPRDDEFSIAAVHSKLIPLLQPNQREIAIVKYTTELLETYTISDATYEETKSILDGKDSILVEITSVVGYYTYVSYTLNAFRIPFKPSPSPPKSNKVASIDNDAATKTKPTKFTSERERRDYALQVAMQSSSGPSHDTTKTKTTAKGRQHYNTGLSDVDLIKDMFS